MKINLSIRYIYQTILFLLLSTATFAFQSSDVVLFKNFLTKNDIRTCTLSDSDYLKVLTNSDLSAYTGCLVVESNQMSLKSGATCSLGRVVNGIIPNMNSLCQAAARQAAIDQQKKSAAGGNGSAKSSGDKTAANHDNSNAINQLLPVAVAAAQVKQARNQENIDKFKANNTAKQPASESNASTTAKNDSSQGQENFRRSEIADQNAYGPGGKTQFDLQDPTKVNERNEGLSSYEIDHKTGVITDSTGKAIDPSTISGQMCSSIDCQKAFKSLSPDLQKKAGVALDKDGAMTTDPKAIEDIANGANSANAAAGNASSGSAMIQQGGCPDPDPDIKEYHAELTKCSESAGKAANFCSMIRSPTAQAVQMLMTAGAAALQSTTSASKNCRMTAGLSKVAQSAMTLAQLTCSGMKMRCDSSCAAATKKYEKLSAKTQQAITCGNGKIQAGSAALVGGAELVREGQSSNVGAQTVQKSIGVTQKDLSGYIAQCEAHSLDIMQMGMQVAGLATAFMQAKDCEKKLTADNGSGDGTPATVADVCQQPANASMQMCKCNANPMAEGCPAAIASKPSDSGKGMTLKTTGVGSQMGGPSVYSQKGLSPGARAALGLDSGNNDGAWGSSPNADAGGQSPFGAVAGAGGGSAGGASGATEGKDKKVAEDKDKKAGGSGLFGGLGGFGGLFGSGDKNKDGRTFKGGNPVDNAKRKLASEDYAAEVSAASGKSNWEKVRNRYVENRGTLLGN